jgi:pimeloyl-ACP methyl ester carboxylesterase
VLDHLGIGEFLAVGVSGGGPFVLAIAHAMPDRLRAAAVCGGSGPLDHADALKGAAPVRRAGYLLARYLPAVFRLVVARITGGKSPEAFAHWYTRHNPASDQAIISGVEFHSMYVANFAEALCQGPAAFADEVTLASRSWGFELEHVRIPVHFWHGELDNSTPIGMSRSMAVRVPSSELTILPGQGHLFVYGPQWRRILGELVAAGKSTTPSSTPK